MSRAFVLVWQLAQPLLFALIGAEINFHVIRPSLVGELIMYYEAASAGSYAPWNR